MARLVLLFICSLTLLAPACDIEDLGGYPIRCADLDSPRSYQTALRAWQPLAEQDLGDAQHPLAPMHACGSGVSRNYADADVSKAGAWRWVG